MPLSTGEIRTYWQVFELYSFSDFYEAMKLIDSIWLNEVQKKSSSKSTIPK